MTIAQPAPVLALLGAGWLFSTLLIPPAVVHLTRCRRKVKPAPAAAAEADPMTARERAYLASLPVPKQPERGRRLADLCRVQAADHVSDLDVARALLVVHRVQAGFAHRRPDVPADRAIALHLDALAGAARHLTELDRTHTGL